MFSELKNFLICNKNERSGIFILITIILIVLLLDRLSLFPAKTAFNDPVLIAKLDSILKQDSLARLRPDSLFHFDPNQINKQGWMLLGLSERQAEVVINYKNAGGKFYRKEDVQKLYSIDDEMYQKLLPYITINMDSSSRKKKNNTASSKKAPVELNTADTAGLQSLYGIGPTFSSRIISYRSLLGGYYSKDQLLEVYGMDSNRWAGFSEQIIIDTSQLIKIRLLTAEFRDILRHPYFSYELTVFIFRNRNKIKEKGPEFLLKFDQMNDSLFRKINPYLLLN